MHTLVVNNTHSDDRQQDCPDVGGGQCSKEELHVG